MIWRNRRMNHRMRIAKECILKVKFRASNCVLKHPSSYIFLKVRELWKKKKVWGVFTQILILLSFFLCFAIYSNYSQPLFFTASNSMSANFPRYLYIPAVSCTSSTPWEIFLSFTISSLFPFSFIFPFSQTTIPNYLRAKRRLYPDGYTAERRILAPLSLFFFAIRERREYHVEIWCQKSWQISFMGLWEIGTSENLTT